MSESAMYGIFLLKLRDRTLWVHSWGLLLWSGGPRFKFVSWRYYHEPGLKAGLSTHYSLRFSTVPKGK